jgi:hypothetical protein
MSGTSKITTVVSVRLPNETVITLKRRIDGKGTHWESVGE